jgi:tRNA threonylcarbamoyladenosine biosynthesis protein TsaE
VSANLTLSLADEAATLDLGRRLAQCVSPGLIRLHGDLGAGKTTLVRGLLRGLGHAGRVKSPTYTLIEPYQTTRMAVSHWDLYRLGSADELDALGLREHDREQELLLVEWPERAGYRLQRFDLDIHLHYDAEGRLALLQAGSDRGQGWLVALSN